MAVQDLREARLALERRDYAKCVAESERILQAGGSKAIQAAALDLRAAALFARADFQGALMDSRQAVQLLPLWPQAHYRAGLCERGLNFFTAARKSFQRGLQLLQQDTSGLTSLAAEMEEELRIALEELEKMAAFEVEAVEGAGAEQGAGEEEGKAPAAAAATASASLSLSSPDASSSSPSDAFEGLEEWLLSTGSSSFPHLYMKAYSPDNRGVHCRTELQPEEEVLSIGREFLITVEVAKECPLCMQLEKASIDHTLSVSKHCYLSIFVLWDMKCNPDSFYQPYYRILPKSFPGIPIFWGDEELCFHGIGFHLHLPPLHSNI